METTTTALVPRIVPFRLKSLFYFLITQLVEYGGKGWKDWRNRIGCISFPLNKEENGMEYLTDTVFSHIWFRKEEKR